MSLFWDGEGMGGFSELGDRPKKTNARPTVIFIDLLTPPAMPRHNIQYSDKYYDDIYEYRYENDNP